jgi:hypothetical protein
MYDEKSGLCRYFFFGLFFLFFQASKQASFETLKMKRMMMGVAGGVRNEHKRNNIWKSD